MKKIALVVATALFTLAWSGTALADPISFTLTNVPTSIAAGTSVIIDGTITSLEASTTEYLNDDSFFTTGPLMLDDTLFFDDAPLSLAPGDSYSGPLFTLSTLSNAQIGDFNGTFTLLGGSDGSTLDYLSSANFATSVTPEPQSLVLLATGMICGLCLLWKRRKAAEESTVVNYV